MTYQEKSHVFNHCAFLHWLFVHGLPYTRGLKYVKFQIAMITSTAAICKRIRGFSVDVTRSKTPEQRSIAKYSAGK